MHVLDINDADINKCFCDFELHTNVKCGLHAHSRMEIVVIKSGSVNMQVGSEGRVLKSGECTVVFPFEMHSFDTPEHSECLVIIFSTEATPDFYEAYRGKTAQNKVISLSNGARTVCDEILPASLGLRDRIRARGVLYPLCAELSEKCFFEGQASASCDSTFTEAVKYIMKVFSAGDASLSATAQAVGVHPVYLSRMFKEKSGVTYSQYVSSVRASYAADKLSQKSNANISKIALDAGFGSIRSFNRAFKKSYGVTPLEYRKKTV